jgi:hypothetical protein
MSTDTTTNALKVRAASYDRLREHLALHDGSDGITRPSPTLLAQASHSRRLLAQDIVNAVRSAGSITDEDLEDQFGIQLGEILDDLVDSDTLWMTTTDAIGTYWIADEGRL